MGTHNDKAAHWASLTDEEIIEIAAPATSDIQSFSGTPGGAAQLEMMRRLTIALRDFHNASDRASKRLERLTFVLVVLTVAILWLTYELVQHPGAG